MYIKLVCVLCVLCVLCSVHNTYLNSNHFWLLVGCPPINFTPSIGWQGPSKSFSHSSFLISLDVFFEFRIFSLCQFTIYTHDVGWGYVLANYFGTQDAERLDGMHCETYFFCPFPCNPPNRSHRIRNTHIRREYADVVGRVALLRTIAERWSKVESHGYNFGCGLYFILGFMHACFIFIPFALSLSLFR